MFEFLQTKLPKLSKMKRVLILLLCFLSTQILSGQYYNFKASKPEKQKLTKKEKELSKIYKRFHNTKYKDVYRGVFVSRNGEHLCGRKGRLGDFDWYKEQPASLLKNAFFHLMDKYPNWGDPYFLYALAVSMEDYKQGNFYYRHIDAIIEAMPYFDKAFELGFSNEAIVLDAFISETIDNQRNYYSPAEFYLSLMVELYSRGDATYDFPDDLSFWTKIEKLMKDYKVGPYKVFFTSQKLIDQGWACVESKDLDCALRIKKELEQLGNCDKWTIDEIWKLGARVNDLQEEKGFSDLKSIVKSIQEYETYSVGEVKEIIDSVLEEFSEEELKIIKDNFKLNHPEIKDRGNSSGYLVDRNGVPIPDTEVEQAINKAIGKSHISFDFKGLFKIKLNYNIISVLDVGDPYITTTTSGIVGKDTKNTKIDVKYLTSNIDNENFTELFDYIEEKFDLTFSSIKPDSKRLYKPRINDKVTISYYLSVIEVNPFIELIKFFNFSSSSSSLGSFKSSDEEFAKTDIPKSSDNCFSGTSKEFKALLNCEFAENDKTQVFSVKCRDGKKYQFYKCLSPKGLIGSDRDANFYFEYKEFAIDTRLDKDREISMKILCKCN